MKKPPVAVDVDDVLADFIGQTLRLVHVHTGKAVPKAKINIWNLEELFAPDILQLITNSWDSRGFCALIPTLPGAPEAIGLLRDTHDVTFVTAPRAGSSFWIDERTRWLKTHFDARDKDVVFETKKHTLVKKYKTIIDDKFKTVYDWGTAGGKAILISQPHNVNENWRHRAPDIGEAVHLLRKGLL